ncbi:MAG: terminase small subunit [Thiopseudomonas sp.]|nr:terminase small subunit [Thiopseudomonas sp.]
MKLTAKQELFCLAYIETNNASEAYRRAYDAGKMKPESVNESASRLLADVKIAARLAELREPIMQRHNVTVDSLVLELEEARQAALSAETPQSSAAVAATMGKAKICGLDKQVIDLMSSDGSMSPAASQEAVLAALARKHAT